MLPVAPNPVLQSRTSIGTNGSLRPRSPQGIKPPTLKPPPPPLHPHSPHAQAPKLPVAPNPVLHARSSFGTKGSLRPRSPQGLKPPPLKPPPSPLHPHSPHAQVLMVNLHSPVHQVVDTRALPTIAPALRRTNLRVVPVVERVQFRKASKTIATRSIGQKYASTKSVRPGARYASKR